MKLFFSILFLLTSIIAFAQSEYSTDTIYVDKTPVSLLKKIGTGFVAYSIDSKQRLISIKENYYRFANGVIAYPDVTVRSAEKTIEAITANGLFDKNGLNDKKVKAFVARYAAPLPVQQISRESRQEINPEIR